MKIFIYNLFIILFLCCASCNNNKKRQNISNVSVEILQCRNCSGHSFDSDSPVCDDIKFVKLETNDSCLITNIRQIEVKDFFIFILDTNLDTNGQLFVFNNDGRLISKIGKYGHGPGEYTFLNAFYVEDNNVVIVDETKNSLIKYDFNGKYLFSEKIPNDIRMSRQIIPTDMNKLLVSHGINMEANMAYSLVNLNNNELIGQYFSYAPIKLNNYAYHYSDHPMTKSPEGINFILPLCDTVYSYNNSVFSPKYVVEIPGKMLSKTQIEENTSDYTKNIIEWGQQGFFTGFTAIFETDSHILLEFKDSGLILGYFLCDKKSKQGTYYFYASDNTYIPFFRIRGSFDDTFVGVSEPDKLLQTEWDIPGETGVQFKNMLSSLREDDNPVLFFYKLKNDC
jgi:hypothetical protein